MLLRELKTYLTDRQALTITLPDGRRVPSHLHVTEVGETTKRFIDCGGTKRAETVASLQFWSAEDTDHRLAGAKLAGILALAERELGLGNHRVEVEYQGDRTIEQYDLAVGPEGELQLRPRRTACLALETCIPSATRLNVVSAASPCTPGSGCC